MGKIDIRRGIKTACLFAAAIFLLTACGSESKPEAESAEGPSGASIKPARVIGIGRIEPELKVLDLYSEVPGLVEEIRFQPGEKAEKGDPMIILSREIETARLKQAEARIATQESRIDSVEAALSSAGIRAADAKKSLRRAKTLLKNDAETQAAYDRAKTAFDTLQQEVRRLEAEVEVNKKLLLQYRADVELARAERDRKTISARVAGRVLTLDITIGSLVVPEKSFGTFALDSPLIARVEVDELFADLVETGQNAEIRRLGESQALAEGRVIFTGPALRRKSLFSQDVGDLEDRRVREIWVGLPETAPLILGMRVECVIQLDSHD